MTFIAGDGYGIDRIPVQLFADGHEWDRGMVLVRGEALGALEDLLYDARNIVALCSSQGVDWSDGEERAGFFAEASVVYDKLAGVLRGDDPVIPLEPLGFAQVWQRFTYHIPEWDGHNYTPTPAEVISFILDTYHLVDRRTL